MTKPDPCGGAGIAPASADGVRVLVSHGPPPSSLVTTISNNCIAGVPVPNPPLANPIP
jgi:hypothetical protein